MFESRKDSDYLWQRGRFFEVFSGSVCSFKVSLLQIRDFMLRKAYAKRELSTNPVGGDLAGSSSDVVTENFEKFMKSFDFGTSGDPKISLGPALTRNANTHVACRDGRSENAVVSSNIALGPGRVWAKKGQRLYMMWGSVF